MGCIINPPVGGVPVIPILSNEYTSVVVPANEMMDDPTNGASLVAYKSGCAVELSTGVYKKRRFNVILPQNYIQGSSVTPRVHWAPETANAGNVKFELSASWANIDATIPNGQSVTSVVATPEEAGDHVLTDMTTFTGPAKTFAGAILFSLARMGDDAQDTYADSVYLLAFDLLITHYNAGSLTAKPE